MPIKSKISIRLKILLLLSGVVFLAVGLYLYLASKIFYEDKMLLIYELNQNNVRTLGAESEAGFNRILDQMRVLAAVYAEDTTTHTNLLPALMGATIGAHHPFAKIAVLEQEPSASGLPNWRELAVLGTWTDFLQVYSQKGSIDSRLFEEIQKEFPIPYERVMKEGVWIRNATLERAQEHAQDHEEAPPLVEIATAVPPNAQGASAPARIIFALVRMEHLMENFQKGGLAQTALLDSDGFVLAHSDPVGVYKSENMNADPLIQAASQVKVRSGVKRFEVAGQSYVGSFYRVGISNLLVVSRVKAAEAFAAARVLFRKSMLYALFVLTVSFLISLFFSHSLTAPIQRLVEATRRVAQGDFGLLVPISSHDELAVLGSSFNSMSVDLQSSRAKIEEYSHDLEKKVIERTLKLEEQNVAIKEAQEALVRTTRLASVGEVAGRAAHEVLNPLTNISIRLEKMQVQKINHEMHDLALFLEITQAWKKDFQEKGAEGFVRALSAPSSAQPEKILMQEDLENLEAIATDLRIRQEEGRGNVDFLLTETGRIAKIINGMRQLTRVSSSRRVFDVHTFLAEAVSTMSDVLHKNKIQVEKHFCPDSLRVLGDHDELLQVLSNLIRNSMQAIVEARLNGQRTGQTLGKPEKIWVSTECGLDDDGARRILVRVSDNGPGIPAGFFNTIFEPSFTTKTSEEGTGLGLSICRRFVRAHEGEIKVEKSEPAKETTFLIDLPAAPEKEVG